MKNLTLTIRLLLHKFFSISRAVLITVLFSTSFTISNNGLYAADYFWVNGTGNWSDFATHWATTSGGAVFHPDVPGANDDVFFDVNSFLLLGEIATVDIPATCNSMDWTGAANNPDFAGFSSLEVYGSLTFIPGMTASYSSWVTFRSSSAGNTVDFSTVTLWIGGIEFNGDGEWTLLSDIDIYMIFGNFTVSKGTLNTNDRTLNVGMFQSWPNGNRTLNLGNSTITTQWMMLWDASTLTLNAGTSTINLEDMWFDGIGLTYYDFNFLPIWSGDIQIMGANTFHVLGLNDTNITGIRFPAGVMNTIFDIDFGATCSNRKNVMSDIPGEEAMIKKITGTMQEDYLNIRDINIIGGASFITDFGIDLGNVTNWTINSSPPGDYFWVGGTGNWSDPDHWGTFSGAPYPTGNTCVPTDVNNVFFDASSFPGIGEVMTIDVVAFCDSMDWTGVLNVPDMGSMWPGELNIYGSLTLDIGMVVSSNATIYFRSGNAGNTITTAGQVLNSSMFFDGAGNWTLQDNLSCGSIYLNQGYLNTNNNNINGASFISGTGLNRQLDLGSSVVIPITN